MVAQNAYFPLCFRCVSVMFPLYVPLGIPLEVPLDFRYISVRFNDNNLSFADRVRLIKCMYVSMSLDFRCMSVGIPLYCR